MQSLKNLKKEEMIRYGAIAAAVIVFLIAAKIVTSMFAGRGQKLSELKSQVQQAETLVEYTSRLDTKKLLEESEALKKRLETPVELPALLQELNRLGERFQVHFRSVTPAEFQSSVLSVHLEMDGSYQSLGEMLGALDEMKTGMVRVRSFEMSNPDPAAPLYMVLDLEIHMPAEAAA